MLYTETPPFKVTGEIDESSINVITRDPETLTLPVAFNGLEPEIVRNGNSQLPASKLSLNRFLLKLTT